MAATAIARQRLRQQRLSHDPLATPAEIVTWMGAVQAQDYLGAKWALGLRMRHATDIPTDILIEQAFAAGTILRTHVLRPTWHFVTPADIRWLLALTAPRVKTASAYMYRQYELDEAIFGHSNGVIARALQGGQQRTRAELGLALADAGIVAEGVRLGYLIQRAELDALVCSGPRRGKQLTYALLDERGPQARPLPRDEALAELTLRYYTSHGPATIQDCVWWSGLTVADVQAGLSMVASEVTREVIDGQTYWFAASLPAADPSPMAYLLPTFDEFLVGYADFGQARTQGLEASPEASKTRLFDATMVVGGQVVGRWKRTFQRGAVRIDIAPFAPLSAADHQAITAAAQRYGEYVGMPITCR